MAVRIGDAPGAHGLFRVRSPRVRGNAGTGYGALHVGVVAVAKCLFTKGSAPITRLSEESGSNRGAHRCGASAAGTKIEKLDSGRRLGFDIDSYGSGRRDTADRVNPLPKTSMADPRNVYSSDADHPLYGLAAHVLSVVAGDEGCGSSAGVAGAGVAGAGVAGAGVGNAGLHLRLITTPVRGA
jgi:hypothetical protein